MGGWCEVVSGGVPECFILRNFMCTFGDVCGFSIVGLLCFLWHFSFVGFFGCRYSFLYPIVTFNGDI
ncbi:hypothetical protein ACUXHH_001350 [Rothia sp. 110740021-2]